MKIEEIILTDEDRRKRNIEMYENMSEKEKIDFKVNSFNEEEGNFNDYDGYNCDICKNKGYIALNIDNDFYLQECECIKTRNSIKNMNESGLKDFIQKYKLNSFETQEEFQKNIKEKALEYINKKTKKWFFIGGQSGSGKTFICSAISRELLLQNKSLYYFQWREDSRKLKAIVNEEKEYDEFMERIKEIDVLYIDDFFKTQRNATITTADINLAFEIINYRYKANKETIISSELTLNEIIDIDEAIGGRIKELSIFIDVSKDRKKNYRLKGEK